MGFVHMWEMLKSVCLRNSFFEQFSCHKLVRSGIKESILIVTIGNGFLPLLIDKPNSNLASPPGY